MIINKIHLEKLRKERAELDKRIEAIGTWYGEYLVVRPYVHLAFSSWVAFKRGSRGLLVVAFSSPVLGALMKKMEEEQK